MTRHHLHQYMRLADQYAKMHASERTEYQHAMVVLTDEIRRLQAVANLMARAHPLPAPSGEPGASDE